MKPSNEHPGGAKEAKEQGWDASGGTQGSGAELTRLLGRLGDGIDGILDAEMTNALSNLGGVGQGSEGDLAEKDMPWILGQAFCEGFTGSVRFQNESTQKSVFFEAGLPVMASSADLPDRMLAMLMREGAIDQRQHDEISRVVDATGRKVGAVLVDLGYLRSDELLPAVRRHYESVILSLFGWDRGRWMMAPGMTAGPDRTRLLRHPALLVRDGLSRGYPALRLSTRLGGGKAVFLLDNSTEAADVAAQVAAEPSEARALPLFDGVRSIDEVVRASSLPAETITRIAFTLWSFGVLRPIASHADLRSARVGVRDLRIDRERVVSRHALAMESDYFRFLGVSAEADAAEIGRAHGRIQKEIAPVTLGPELWHELKPMIETIQEVLDEALRVLCTPALRAAYEFNLTHGPDADVEPEQDGAPVLEAHGNQPNHP